MGTVNGTRTALLVVDVQQANTDDGYERAEVYGRIRGLIDRAKAADAPVVWIQHETQNGPMDRGSDGWRIVPEVAPATGETVIAKRYLDSFADTPLRDTLDELGVGRLPRRSHHLGRRRADDRVHQLLRGGHAVPRGDHPGRAGRTGRVLPVLSRSPLRNPPGFCHELVADMVVTPEVDCHPRANVAGVEVTDLRSPIDTTVLAFVKGPRVPS